MPQKTYPTLPLNVPHRPNGRRQKQFCQSSSWNATRTPSGIYNCLQQLRFLEIIPENLARNNSTDLFHEFPETVPLPNISPETRDSPRNSQEVSPGTPAEDITKIPLGIPSGFPLRVGAAIAPEILKAFLGIISKIPLGILTDISRNYRRITSRTTCKSFPSDFTGKFCRSSSKNSKRNYFRSSLGNTFSNLCRNSIIQRNYSMCFCTLN